MNTNEFYHYINEFIHFTNEFYHYIIKYHWISMNFIIISMNLFIMPMNFIIISMNLIIISINLNTHTQAFQRLRAAHSLSSQQHIWLTSTVYRSSIDFHWRNCIYVAHVWFGFNVFFNSLLVWEYLCLFLGSYENIYVFCR